MGNQPRCKQCGCLGIHACMGSVQCKVTRAEKRLFHRKLAKAMRELKKARAIQLEKENEQNMHNPNQENR